MSAENYDRRRITRKGENVFSAILKIAEQAREIVEEDDSVLTSQALTEVFDKNYPKIKDKVAYLNIT